MIKHIINPPIKFSKTHPRNAALLILYTLHPPPPLVNDNNRSKIPKTLFFHTYGLFMEIYGVETMELVKSETM